MAPMGEVGHVYQGDGVTLFGISVLIQYFVIDVGHRETFQGPDHGTQKLKVDSNYHQQFDNEDGKRSNYNMVYVKDAS